MIKRILSTLFVITSITSIMFSQTQNEVIQINNDLRLIKISNNAFIHESFSSSERFGRFGSNGLLLVDKGIAFLFDTPMIDSVTQQLLTYIQDSLKLKIVGFITNDWHGDSMGGLQLIKDNGIPSYSNEMTREIAKEKGLPIPDYGFKDTMTIKFASYDLVCRYHGAAHTLDNIVVWIPQEKILFADCMIKEVNSRNLGFTGDGDLEAYPLTLKKVREAYPDSKIVIPGHGKYGGIELIDHTLELTVK